MFRESAGRQWPGGALALSLAFTLGCGSDGPSGPEPPDPPPAPTAEFQVVQGADQSAPAGTTLPYISVVRLVDAEGAPRAGVSVTFEVAGGGGRVFPVISQTSSAGVAAANWRLGPAAGTNTLRVTAPDAEPLEIRATGRAVQTPFDIELSIEDPSDLAPSHLAALEAAVLKVRSIFAASPPDVEVDTQGFQCGGIPVPAMSRTVANPIVQVAVREFGVDEGVEDVNPDFAGIGTVCSFLFIQGRDDFRMTVIGAIALHPERLDDLDSVGGLEAVLAHELMHAMGFGSIWGGDPNLGWTDLVQGRGGADPRFTGSTAIAAYGDTEGNAEGAVPVPVENEGGTGSSGSHWRASLLSFELMNAKSELGFTPLSPVSVASLGDLGYTMRPAEADPFAAEPPAAARVPAPSAARVELSAALAQVLEPELLGHACGAHQTPRHRALAIDLGTGTHTWRSLP